MAKRRKGRGHYCWMCGRMRPNERFSGRGHRQHLCKDCKRQYTKAERRQARAKMDMEGYFHGQKNISAKNVAHLRGLSKSSDEDVRTVAEAILEAALLHPRRRGRQPYLAKNHPELYARLVELYFCEPWVEDADPEPDWFDDGNVWAGGPDYDEQYGQVMQDAAEGPAAEADYEEIPF
jgi:hypothetical protein